MISKVDPLGWVPSGNRWAPSLRYLLRRARVLEAMPPLKGQKMLEVGCGAATLLIELSNAGLECTGLELSPQAIGLARELTNECGSSINLYEAPQTDWNSFFDIVGAFDVLEHIENDADAVAQWYRWLKPGGCLLLTVPAHPSRWGAGDEWAGHYRRYARDLLQVLVRNQGLRIERFECYGFPVANLTEMLGESYYRRALRKRKERGAAREDGNALSGVDREAYRAALPWLTSLPGRLLLWCMYRLQSLTLHTDWGSGYLLVARKT